MASCNDNISSNQASRILGENVAFFLSSYKDSVTVKHSLTTTATPRPRQRQRRNRESKIFQHIQLFEGNITPFVFESRESSMSMNNTEEPLYENLKDVARNLLPRNHSDNLIVPKRKPMPNPRLSLVQMQKSETIPQSPVEKFVEKRVEKVLSPRRRSIDGSRLLQPPSIPPPPPPSRPSNVTSPIYPQKDFSLNLQFDKYSTRSSLPVNNVCSQNSPESPLTTPNEKHHISKRPLPDIPNPNISENYGELNGEEPEYEELTFNNDLRSPKENAPVAKAAPALILSGNKCRENGRKQLAKNFRSLRGLPQELDEARPKPRATSFTTADLFNFPPRANGKISSYSHSATCSSISLTESDSGVSLEQESNKDDSSLFYARYGVSLSGSEFQQVVHKFKGFQNRSESLNSNDVLVKNTCKPIQDRNRRHTLPVSSLLCNSRTVFDYDDEELVGGASVEEIAHYPLRSLWCQRPFVIQSGILEKLSEDERKLQEAIYEIISSEASHLRSLNILINIFKNAAEFRNSEGANPGEISLSIISAQEERNLFLNISDIRKLSQNLLKQLHECCLDHQEATGMVTMPDFCDILEDFAVNRSKPYVHYCSNQLFQDRTLKGLKERKRFQEVIRRLESDPTCELLDFRSYLMLPMQRITRLPLLLTAIIKRLKSTSQEFARYSRVLQALNKVVKDCDEGAKRCACIEELCRIDSLLQFDVSLKKIAIISASRCLVKRGTVDMIQIEHKILPRRTFHKKAVHLLLFNDLFVLTKPRSGSEEALTVMDYCPRNLLDCLPVSTAERDDLLAHTAISAVFTTPESFRGVKLVLLRNSVQKTVEFFVVMSLESDYMRWMSVLNPSEKVDGEETVYEVWDCPQYEVLTDYTGKEKDELNLQVGDVVDIYRKSSDGWMEGRKLSDGQRGWLPMDIARELMTEHARARILKQRNRLLTASAQLMQDRFKTLPHRNSSA